MLNYVPYGYIYYVRLSQTQKKQRDVKLKKIFVLIHIKRLKSGSIKNTLTNLKRFPWYAKKVLDQLTLHSFAEPGKAIINYA